MKRDELRKLGIESDEVLDQIMALHGRGIEKMKSDLEATNTELTGLKAQLQEASATIEGFKKLDIDGVRASADEWKRKAETAQQEAAATIHQLKFNHALESALAGARAKNTKAVAALLNTGDMKLGEDGAIVGLTEQLAKVREESAYLFEASESEPKVVVTGGKARSIITDSVVDAARRAAGLPVAE